MNIWCCIYSCNKIWSINNYTFSATYKAPNLSSDRISNPVYWPLAMWCGERIPLYYETILLLKFTQSSSYMKIFELGDGLSDQIQTSSKPFCKLSDMWSIWAVTVSFAWVVLSDANTQGLKTSECHIATINKLTCFCFQWALLISSWCLNA